LNEPAKPAAQLRALAGRSGGKGGGQVQGGGQSGGFKKWAGISPGDLKHQIENAFDGSAAGAYYALALKCDHAITDYEVEKIPVAGETGFEKWEGLSAGKLKQDIEDRFQNCQPGQYHALILECKNPISGYKVVQKPI
jgi:hypothetical protein